MSPAAYGAAIAAKKHIVGGNGVLTSDSTIDRVRPVAPTMRAARPGLDDDLACEIVACTAADVAALDPASPHHARGDLVWPRAAVRGRLGLAGNAEIRA